MEKKDSKIIIRVVVAIAIVFAAFVLLDFIDNPSITAKTIKAVENAEASCVTVVDMGYKGINDKDNCCRMIQQTDRCVLLDGVLRLEFTEGSRTAEPQTAYNANYACYAGPTTIYFSFKYEYLIYRKNICFSKSILLKIYKSI